MRGSKQPAQITHLVDNTVKIQMQMCLFAKQRMKIYNNLKAQCFEIKVITE